MLPRTRIGIKVPTEGLYHVTGTPREKFQPLVVVDVARAGPGVDPFVDAALLALTRQ